MKIAAIEALVPSVHRAVVVVIANAHQIGQLLAPHLAAGLGRPTRAAVEHRIDQTAAMHQNQGSGGIDGLPSAWGLRFDALVHLAGNGGFHIEVALFAPLPEGVGACGNRLGLERGERPAGRHLTAHHTGQIGLDPKPVDGQHATAPGQKQHIPAVAPLAEPEAPGIIRGHAQGWRLTQTIEKQGAATEADRQPLQRALLSSEAAHPQRQRSIGPELQRLCFGNKNPHHRLLGGHRNPRLTRKGSDGKGRQRDSPEHWPQVGDERGHSRHRWAPSVPLLLPESQASVADWPLSPLRRAGHLSRHQFRSSDPRPQRVSRGAASAATVGALAV